MVKSFSLDFWAVADTILLHSGSNCCMGDLTVYDV